MTLTALCFDVAAELTALREALEARRDPAYEAFMRRIVPSQARAHATRVPAVRAVAAEWRRAHRDLTKDELLALCDALWTTQWREERLLAVMLAEHARPKLTSVDWPRLEAWSVDIENWEHVDNLAPLTGRLLVADSSLAARVEALSLSDNPWQRRLALVSLIDAFRHDESWRTPLVVMAERLRRDPHPLVRKAVVWARDRLSRGAVA